MLHDTLFALRQWRLVHLLGIASLRSRYARSRFGQMWLTISMAVQILLTGLVWALIFKMPIDAFLPYLGVGFIAFGLLSQTLSEGTSVFINDARLYLNDRAPFMTSVLAHLYRNVIVLVHNLPTAVALVLWSTDAHLAMGWDYPLAVLATLLFLLTSTYTLASACTRYRDLIQIVGIVLQSLFLVTPLVWSIEFIPPQFQAWIFINPLAAFLELLRNPLLGKPVHGLAWPSALAWLGVAVLMTFFVHRRYEKRIILWV